MVPGINDSEKEIRAIARVVKRELGLSKINLHLYIINWAKANMNIWINPKFISIPKVTRV